MLGSEKVKSNSSSKSFKKQVTSLTVFNPLTFYIKNLTSSYLGKCIVDITSYLFAKLQDPMINYYKFVDIDSENSDDQWHLWQLFPN